DGGRSAHVRAGLITVPDRAAMSDLRPWAPEAPPKALAHERVSAALRDRARIANAATPMC
ncbi:hypothetical protein, partial [Roseiflexus castenholzii]|uniref:hypothetical protein n=1 Tax=Roseiflexus castenholzii TaxID=120962 RepID=UPI003C7E7AF6